MKRGNRNNKKQQKASQPPPELNKAKSEKEVIITDEEINEIWDLLGTLEPAEAEAFLKEFPQEIIEKIRVTKNPYKLPVFTNGDHRWLIGTVIPISEIYARRLAMTGLVGFIFRMVDEYKPKKLNVLPSEEGPEFQTEFAKHIKELEQQRPFKEIEDKQNVSRTYIQALENLISERDGEAQDADNDRVDANPDDEHDGWDNLKTQSLKKLKTRYERELLEWNALHLLYKLHQNESESSELKVKLTGVNKKLKDATDLFTEVEKIIDKYTKELIMLEELYASNPEAEPRDNIPGAKKHRDDKAPPTRSRQVVRDALEHYKTKIEEAKTEKAKQTDEKQTLETKIAELAQEFSQINNGPLTDMRKEYYNKYGNPNYGKHQSSKNKQTKQNQKDKNQQKKVKKTKEPWYNVFSHLTFDDFEATDEDYTEARNRTKQALNIEKTYEEKAEKVQNYISDFLQEYFVYNPDNHVACAYKPNYEDPSRTPLEIDEHRKNVEKEYNRSLVPPADTFHRLQRYIDNNYEQIRQATDDIYCEKSDLELNIVPMEVFEERDQDKAREYFGEFSRKYRKEFEAEPRLLKFRINNLLGAWQQNREKIDFYNENTEIIKRIIDQHKKDNKMGPELMKDRIHRKREKHVHLAGEKDTKFKEYKSQAGPRLETLGAKQPEDMVLTESDIPKDREAAGDDEIEMGVHVIKPVRHGRRIYGRTKQSHFNLPALDPEEGAQINLKTATEQQQEYIDKGE